MKIQWFSLIEEDGGPDYPQDTKVLIKGNKSDPEEVSIAHHSSRIGDWICKGDPTHWAYLDMSKEDTPQGDIVEKLSRIAGSITHIGKDQKNQSQGFKFRGVDQVLNKIHEPFSKEGVVLLPKVLSHQIFERPTRSGGIQFHHVLSVEFVFTSSDGSTISCVMPGEAMDSGDKGASKAMSIALKQAMFQVLTLPVEEQSIEDPDRHTPEETSVPLASEQAKHEIEELLDQVKKIDPEIESKVFAFAKVKSVNEIQAKQVASIVKKLKTTLETKTNG